MLNQERIRCTLLWISLCTLALVGTMCLMACSSASPQDDHENDTIVIDETAVMGPIEYGYSSEWSTTSDNEMEDSMFGGLEGSALYRYRSNKTLDSALSVSVRVRDPLTGGDVAKSPSMQKDYVVELDEEDDNRAAELLDSGVIDGVAYELYELTFTRDNGTTDSSYYAFFTLGLTTEIELQSLYLNNLQSVLDTVHFADGSAYQAVDQSSAIGHWEGAWYHIFEGVTGEHDWELDGTKTFLDVNEDGTATSEDSDGEHSFSWTVEEGAANDGIVILKLVNTSTQEENSLAIDPVSHILEWLDSDGTIIEQSYYRLA